uniref:Helicase-associated domain-containing protein n=1 Tax=Pseudictyota dubia TaxID=2749911 RepID=A0A7R9Z3P0_9STRA|mmetsp:Transcript_20949/g.39262  ORF Transcript_20949/g.39262 Transcript_20949/m.39262 type:complete len:348 (+) Transcript_20949:380-1423(+)
MTNSPPDVFVGGSGSGDKQNGSGEKRESAVPKKSSRDERWMERYRDFVAHWDESKRELDPTTMGTNERLSLLKWMREQRVGLGPLRENSRRRQWQSGRQQQRQRKTKKESESKVGDDGVVEGSQNAKDGTGGDDAGETDDEAKKQGSENSGKGTSKSTGRRKAYASTPAHLERIRLLDAAGFDWYFSRRGEKAVVLAKAKAKADASNKHQIQWRAKFDELKAFHERHGHSDVAPGLEGYTKQLSDWSARQRCLRRAGSEGGGRGSSSLTEERIELLDGIGFAWVEKKPRTSSSSTEPTRKRAVRAEKQREEREAKWREKERASIVRAEKLREAQKCFRNGSKSRGGS